MTNRGLFVTLEGIDRSGKSTQAALLAEALGALALREPGGTELGERVRALVKDPSVRASARSEALLFAAARAQLVSEVIDPALADGRPVVCDRFLDSSLAYQGVARGLGFDTVREMNRGALTPDLTVLLDLDPRRAAQREGDLDRIESEGQALQERVSEAYHELARADPARWRVIDADDAEHAVHVQVLEAVRSVRGQE